MKRAPPLLPQPSLQFLPTSLQDPQALLAHSRWIRDTLDPLIARNGPDALHSDDILTLDEFLRRLLSSNLSVDNVRSSRLHLALLSIVGRATRWPRKLIERAEAVRVVWEAQFGDLKALPAPSLFDHGGRLEGICSSDDLGLTKDRMLAKWLKMPGVKLSPLVARRVGALGFTAGDWFLSPLFAFRAGIIDSSDSIGGITSDNLGAYAILMTSDEEVLGPSAEKFTYRARADDLGRYRLTAATRESRLPVRVLRAHGLRSFWAPKVGVRYDGLHMVTGWSIAPDPKTKSMIYEVKFKRLSSEPSMEEVLKRPYADEVEDYKEYKRIRNEVRMRQDEASKAKKAKRVVLMPEVLVHASQDGTDEWYDEDGDRDVHEGRADSGFEDN